MLALIYYPDSRLRSRSREISVFNDELRELAVGMNETMNSENGIGLAAPQVGKNIRLIIVKDGDDAASPFRVYINPSITFYSKKKTAIEEGCLSIPGVLGYVERSAKIHVRYQDLSGAACIEKASGMRAIVLQHEVDHIDGILIIDRRIQITKGAEFLEHSKSDARS